MARRKVSWGGALLIAALLSNGCAAALVNAENVLHRTIAVTQDTADTICDAGMADAAACKAFNVRLVIIISSAKEFNRSVRNNSAGEIPAMLHALIALRDEAAKLFADEAIRRTVVDRIESAYGMVAALKK